MHNAQLLKLALALEKNRTYRWAAQHLEFPADHHPRQELERQCPVTLFEPSELSRLR